MEGKQADSHTKSILLDSLSCQSFLVGRQLEPNVYIILSNLGEYNNLGHELFFTRKILFVLLHHNLIKTDITLVTSYNDRNFLYKKYFNNVITFKEFDSISTQLEDNDILDLTCYLATNYIDTIKEIKHMNHITLSFRN